jgi:CBS domain containing-hemolysin-like protein
MSSGTALLIAGLFVLANAFFVASEFAIVKLRATRARQLAEGGQKRAKILSHITQRLDAYLSANQLGITLASLGLGWIGEPALARLLEPHVARLGLLGDLAPGAVAFGVAFFAMTFVHTVIGELVPKSLAIQRTEPVALWTAAPLRAFFIIAYPLIWFLNACANLFLRLVGLKPASEGEMLHSPEEVRLVLAQVKIDPGARRLIDRVFDYTHRVARHVMTLRRDVVVLVAGRNFDDNLRVAVTNQYTRYPLVDPRTDAVIGYVHLKDIVAALASERRPQRMREIARQPIYVSEETRLEWLRREFQRRRVHIAIVLGEQDRFVGIVTMEDLLEEFVGEIQDEQDVGEVPPLVRAAGGRFEADARVTLDVAARELGLRLPPRDSGIDTLGLYVEAELGRPPRPGDGVEIGGVLFTSIDVRDGHIRRIRGEPVPGDEDEEDERAGGGVRREPRGDEGAEAPGGSESTGVSHPVSHGPSSDSEERGGG